MLRALIFFTTGVAFLGFLALRWSEKPLSKEVFTETEKKEGRSPASAPSSAPSSSQPKNNSPSREIERLEACYESEACDFPKDESLAYHFGVSHALAAAILEFAEKNPGAEKELGELARRQMQNSEPWVQAAALKVLGRIPPSAENARAISEGLRNTPDALLVENAVRELERYLGTPWESEAQRIVGEIAAQGAHFSSQQAALMILPFINAQSEREFRALLTGMEAGSTAASHLRSALEEYRRQSTGG